MAGKDLAGKDTAGKRYGGKLREKIRPTKIWRETIEREIFSTWKERQRASLVTGNSIDRMIILLATQHLIINSDR